MGKSGNPFDEATATTTECEACGSAIDTDGARLEIAEYDETGARVEQVSFCDAECLGDVY
ncbi:DUF7576 family protein [Haloferax larsenii]|uniref:DUF7576 family protein n=1 Tax=Haloferax larsenii TaxID=302484 RepID=UPI003CCD42C6